MEEGCFGGADGEGDGDAEEEEEEEEEFDLDALDPDAFLEPEEEEEEEEEPAKDEPPVTAVDDVAAALAEIKIKPEPVESVAAAAAPTVKPEPEDAEVKLEDAGVAVAVAVAPHPVQIKEEPVSDDESEPEIVDELTPLALLLRECGQTDADVLPMRDAIKRFTGEAGTVKKIGEGTYGEAFKGEGIVLKIVPMGGAALINGEPQIGPAQIKAEAAIAKRLTALRADGDENASASTAAPTNFTQGFIRTEAVAVCRGPYAPSLLDAWTAYDELRTSENENPANFDPEQLYVVFACDDGGVDLERVKLRSYAEARSTLLQVTVALAVAEEAMRFEHRDLHWGNVLLSRANVRADERRTARINGVDITYPLHGLEVNVIDFTLSRLDLDSRGDVAFCDLGQDPELFEGPSGHCQSDTYRRMRKATKGRWEEHCPKTNALWLHYLADCLLAQKEFPAAAEERAAIKAFKKRAFGYKSAAEALWDDMFVGVFTTSHANCGVVKIKEEPL